MAAEGFAWQIILCSVILFFGNKQTCKKVMLLILFSFPIQFFENIYVKNLLRNIYIQFTNVHLI